MKQSIRVDLQKTTAEQAMERAQLLVASDGSKRPEDGERAVEYADELTEIEWVEDEGRARKGLAADMASRQRYPLPSPLGVAGKTGCLK